MDRPEGRSLDELERDLMCWSANIAASMCHWLLMVAEFDRREGYARWEVRSTAHWLSWKCGLALATGRDHVRVARALESLPKTVAAFSTGELTYSTVRAITRVATPETEEYLVEMAGRMTGNQLEEAITAYETQLRAVSLSEVEAAIEGRAVQRRRSRDGRGWTWTITVTDDEDELMRRSLELISDRDREERKAASEGARVDRMSRVDAFLALVDEGGRSAATNDEAPLPRYLVVLHTDGEGIVGDTGDVHLSGGVSLHPRTAQRLACEALVQLAVDDGSEASPLNLGRQARFFNRQQRRAIAFKHPTCGFPGCEVPERWCQYHHVDPWARGGTTDRANGVPLCRKHHRAVHEGGWKLVARPDGKSYAAISPDGRHADPRPPTPHGEAVLDPAVEPNYDPYWEPRASIRNVVNGWIERDPRFDDAPLPAEIADLQRRVNEAFGAITERLDGTT